MYFRLLILVMFGRRRSVAMTAHVFVCIPTSATLAQSVEALTDKST